MLLRTQRFFSNFKKLGARPGLRIFGVWIFWGAGRVGVVSILAHTFSALVSVGVSLEISKHPDSPVNSRSPVPTLKPGIICATLLAHPLQTSSSIALPTSAAASMYLTPWKQDISCVGQTLSFSFSPSQTLSFPMADPSQERHLSSA
jgi:hypothetical protein